MHNEEIENVVTTKFDNLLESESEKSEKSNVGSEGWKKRLSETSKKGDRTPFYPNEKKVDFFPENEIIFKTFKDFKIIKELEEKFEEIDKMERGKSQKEVIADSKECHFDEEKQKIIKEITTLLKDKENPYFKRKAQLLIGEIDKFIFNYNKHDNRGRFDDYSDYYKNNIIGRLTNENERSFMEKIFNTLESSNHKKEGVEALSEFLINQSLIPGVNFLNRNNFNDMYGKLKDYPEDFNKLNEYFIAKEIHLGRSSHGDIVSSNTICLIEQMKEGIIAAKGGEGHLNEVLSENGESGSRSRSNSPVGSVRSSKLELPSALDDNKKVLDEVDEIEEKLKLLYNEVGEEVKLELKDVFNEIENLKTSIKNTWHQNHEGLLERLSTIREVHSKHFSGKEEEEGPVCCNLFGNQIAKDEYDSSSEDSQKKSKKIPEMQGDLFKKFASEEIKSEGLSPETKKLFEDNKEIDSLCCFKKPECTIY